MKKICIALIFSANIFSLFAQSNPAITKWLFNTTGITGRHYATGNPTPINDATLANVQQVRYSVDYAFIDATGIPSYITGPYALGISSLALNNNYVFKIPLNPVQNTGTPVNVGMGAVAVFINGTVAYNNRDAATYNNAGQWHQNAVYFENNGFDCAHGHPGPMTSDYHVHQNPTAFNISSIPMSSICNVYLADGLYVPDSSHHGPLLGFASDGFPIYGAYGYSDPLDSTSAIKRITPGYHLRNITSRTTLPDGTPAAGPNFTDMITSMLPGSTPLPAVLGAYSEDYEFVSGSGDLDLHNGRFCKTPDYPNGIYCYFATIDSVGNPVFPYILGSTYYGMAPAGGPGSSFAHSTVTGSVTTYVPSTTGIQSIDDKNLDVTVFPSSPNEILVIQSSISQTFDRKVELISIEGKIVQTQVLYQGSTMCYFDLQTVYAGVYFVKVSAGDKSIIKKVLIAGR
jgi:hypothetical protein